MLGHLKDYPISLPRKPMPLNGYKPKMSRSNSRQLEPIDQLHALGSSSSNLSPSPRPTASSPRPVSSPRGRSRSDLSESSRSNYSTDDFTQTHDSEDAASVLTTNTSCPSSPSKSASPSPTERQQHSAVNTPVKSSEARFDASSVTSSNSSTSIISTPQDDYLNLIEPHPIYPPDYSTLPPGGCPRFPVVCDPAGESDNLPDYSPSVYKLGLITRKVEWVSPYEASSSRSWKSYIMELNSTQLNLYAVPSNVEAHLASFQIDNLPSAYCDQYMNYSTNFKVQETDDFRHLKSDLTNRYDYEFFQLCERLRVPRKLVRSYSLQHCRIGLASDYKKRTNVLRLRIESEQILLAFQNTKDLIDWNLALNIGRDLSLDLIDRELPKYRTVPRRRRRRADGGVDPLYLNFNSHSDDHTTAAASSRFRSNSEPTTLMHKMSKLKLKLRRDSSSSVLNNLNNLNSSTMNIGLTMDSRSTSVTSMSSICEPSSIEPSGVEDDDDISDYNSEEDLEDLDDDERDPEINRIKKVTRPRSKTDEKWNPHIEAQTIRKYYKNCIRCIKPLNFDDSWVSKQLVKPTSFNLINLSYSQSNSNVNLQTVQNFKKSDVCLSRVPQHFVKEYIVGTHGLIPRQQIH